TQDRASVRKSIATEPYKAVLLGGVNRRAYPSGVSYAGVAVLAVGSRAKRLKPPDPFPAGTRHIQGGTSPSVSTATSPKKSTKRCGRFTRHPPLIRWRRSQDRTEHRAIQRREALLIPDAD